MVPKPIEQILREMRESGEVPLAVLAYDVEKDSFIFKIFKSVDPDEVNALIAKLGIKFIPVKE